MLCKSAINDLIGVSIKVFAEIFDRKKNQTWIPQIGPDKTSAVMPKPNKCYQTCSLIIAQLHMFVV